MIESDTRRDDIGNESRVQIKSSLLHFLFSKNSRRKGRKISSQGRLSNDYAAVSSFMISAFYSPPPEGTAKVEFQELRRRGKWLERMRRPPRSNTEPPT